MIKALIESGVPVVEIYKKLDSLKESSDKLNKEAQNFLNSIGTSINIERVEYKKDSNTTNIYLKSILMSPDGLISAARFKNLKYISFGWHNRLEIELNGNFLKTS